MGDENDKIFDLIIDGQKEIFAKLETMSTRMQDVPLLRYEIDSIKGIIAKMDLQCMKHNTENKTPPEAPSVMTQIKNDLIRATVFFVFCVLAFTCFNNVTAYMNQKHSITVEKGEK